MSHNVVTEYFSLKDQYLAYIRYLGSMFDTVVKRNYSKWRERETDFKAANLPERQLGHWTNHHAVSTHRLSFDRPLPLQASSHTLSFQHFDILQQFHIS